LALELDEGAAAEPNGCVVALFPLLPSDTERPANISSTPWDCDAGSAEADMEEDDEDVDVERISNNDG